MSEPVREYCHEWLDDKNNYCNKPAEFLLWGKLINSAGCGPRCYDHAAKWIDHRALSRHSGYAVLDLRGLAWKDP